MNDRNYFLYLSRSEVCDLLVACTSIVDGAKWEMKSPDCPEYRRDNVLPSTIQKWQKLHDKLEQQLSLMDAIADSTIQYNK